MNINRWSFRKLLVVVLSAQLGLFGVLLLIFLQSGGQALGTQSVAVARAITVVAHFTFVPGIVLVYLLPVTDSAADESILYAVGLSLLSLMLTGLLVDFIPVTEFDPGTVVGAVWVVTSFLTFVAYIFSDSSFHRQRRSEPRRNASHGFSTETILTVLIAGCALVIAIVGARLASESNLLLMIVIPLFGLIVLFVSFNESTSVRAYELLIYLLSLALFYHQSLVSSFLWGWDIHREYFFADLVVQNGTWFSSLQDVYNAMLSIVFLGPMYSVAADLSLTWVFKLVFPAVFAVVPVCLFQCYRTQLPDKAAFLSAFLFTAYFGFYFLMPQLARQQVAELFLALLLLTLVTTAVSGVRRKLLLVVLFTGIVLSHYGTIVIVSLTLFSAYVLYIIFTRQKYLSSLHEKFRAISFDQWHLSGGVLAVSTLIMLGWFLYAADGQVLQVYGRVAYDTTRELVLQLTNPESTEGSEQVTTTATSSLRSVERSIHQIGRAHV